VGNVGSCAQIGKTCLVGASASRRARAAAGCADHHQGQLFHGARSEVVEGVIVEEGSRGVISMGVFIGPEHPHLRSRTGQILQGRVPPDLSWYREPAVGDGKYSLYCAVIVSA